MQPTDAYASAIPFGQAPQTAHKIGFVRVLTVIIKELLSAETQPVMDASVIVTKVLKAIPVGQYISAVQQIVTSMVSVKTITRRMAVIARVTKFGRGQLATVQEFALPLIIAAGMEQLQMMMPLTAVTAFVMTFGLGLQIALWRGTAQVTMTAMAMV